MQLADGVIVLYLQSINFSKTVVDEALGKEKQFKNFFANVEVYLRQPVWRICVVLHADGTTISYWLCQLLSSVCLFSLSVYRY